ncbi:MAG TPA: glutamine amidotransferase, partial [Erysipelotrichaceae bacterium]|nr:glutamine amidotransferase [Erysipelotrichaceae bacterium]
PKNPEVADFVIARSLQKDDPDFKYTDLKKLDDVWENKAREAILSKLEK